jgi:hypothetical protein
VRWTEVVLVYSFITAATPSLGGMSTELNTGLGRNMIDRCVTDIQTGSANAEWSLYELQKLSGKTVATGRTRTQSVAGSEERILGSSVFE